MRTILASAALLLLVGCSGTVTGGSDGGTGGTGGEVPCADCLAETVSWGATGGLTAYDDTSALTSCRTYTHTRTPTYSGEPSVSCSNEIGGCDAAAIAVHDVEQAIAHPDVVAALGSSVQVYGTDPRPCDGSVLSISVGGKSALVGGECGSGLSCGQDTCVPVPPGLRALADFLRELDAQALAVGDCATAFPGQ